MEFPAYTRKIAFTLAAALTLVATPVIADDGTEGLLPELPHSCAVVPATFTTSGPAPQASPVAIVATPMASPVASPAASPVMVASPEASPVAVPLGPTQATPVGEASDPLTADLQAATHAVLDCMSENNVEVLLQITGEEFRSSWLGMGTPLTDAEFAALMPFLPTLPYELVDIEVTENGRDAATAIVTYTGGRQLLTSEWTFAIVEVGDQRVWKAQGEEMVPTEAPANAARLDLTITDGAFTFASPKADAGDVVINVTNTGTAVHEVLIVRAPDGVTAGDFAAAPTGIPDGSTYIAQLTVPTGESGVIVLKDLRAGTYTVVDLLPDATGMPNVSNGMITTFTVQEP